ncbi:MAG: hypothetical protein JO359_00090, partial [Candidatus Eremiobacteraeota bacterium]|nr:hypothetical protein [Candidatus Eremiobacteraeota bacterium]
TAGGDSGIVGTTSAFLSIDPGDGPGKAGILGIDLSVPNNPSEFDYTSGLFGYSKNGDGSISVANIENGAAGLTFNPSASSGFGSYGMVGIDASSDGGTYNVGAAGISSGVGVLAYGFAPPEPSGQSQYPALQVGCFSGGPAMIATSFTSSSSKDVMSLDCAGNLIVAGSVVSNGTPLIRTRSGGGSVAAYAARSTTDTIEDVGEARLAEGEARVALDSAFRSTISSRPYLAFVTPEGDSRGLFVAERDANGFTVRENGGGRDTLAFEYRIVAHPLDASAARLPDLAHAPTAPLHSAPRRSVRTVFGAMLRHVTARLR